MDIRTTLARAAALILLAVVMYGAVTVSFQGTPATLVAPDVRTIASSESDEVDDALTSSVEVGIASGPIVDVRGGTDQQHRLLNEVVDRFTAAGLSLPRLQVTFAQDDTACRGHLGLYESKPRPRRITICSDLPFVPAHELGHAWVSVGSGPDARERMMEILDLEVWASPDTPWNRRGAEYAAVVIQQAVAGVPLPTTLGATQLDRLAAYEALTGRVAPALIDWIGDRKLGCDERPTALSRGVRDSAGRECAPNAAPTLSA